MGGNGMHISVDLAAVFVNLLVYAYSYGRLSQKIVGLEQRLTDISAQLIKMNNDYYSNKDGIKLEARIDTLWMKFDNLQINNIKKELK